MKLQIERCTALCENPWHVWLKDVDWCCRLLWSADTHAGAVRWASDYVKVNL